MNIGTAQIEITPPLGLDLAGFAIRKQPSTDVLDPLYTRVLYIEDGLRKLLWLHCDLLAIEQQMADRIRNWCQQELGIPAAAVMISTTHTHSGPAMLISNGCGELDTSYVGRVEGQMRSAAIKATGNVERCRLVATQGLCERGVDRRGFASAHTDPRVGALGWTRDDGTFKAALISYGMHPVCLRSTQISADWPGVAAHCLSGSLPGNPLCVVLSGASGNINPPAVGVGPKEMAIWGKEVALSVSAKLISAARSSMGPGLRLSAATSSRLDLPLDPWGDEELEECIAQCRADKGGYREFGEKFEMAIDAWRLMMLKRFKKHDHPVAPAVLGLARFEHIAFLTVNAEVFSRFTELATSGGAGEVYTVGCTNGMIGYLATAEAYDEGAYEVAWSMLFYNLPRPRRGGLEMLASHAEALLNGKLHNHFQENHSK
ncbi:MAG TPA: hypothetical protein VH595_23180 [Verrucomicrobiae bacterium]|jgi:hypothetical protein|nr:hypothetical protein [Verrucomicrobiae bacterium]